MTAAFVISGRELHADKFRLWSTYQPTGKFAEALVALQESKVKEADALFRAVLEKDPDMAYAALGRAQIAITQENLDAAEAAVTAVPKKQPSMSEAHNMKGLVLMLRKKPVPARAEFTEAIRLAPSYVTPRLYMAAMSRADGNFSQALRDYQGLTRIAPGLAAGYIGQAEAHMMLGKPADAFKVLESWKQASPKALMPYQVIGALHVANGAPRKAIDELQAALRLNSSDAATMTASAGRIWRLATRRLRPGSSMRHWRTTPGARPRPWASRISTSGQAMFRARSPRSRTCSRSILTIRSR